MRTVSWVSFTATCLLCTGVLVLIMPRGKNFNDSSQPQEGRRLESPSRIHFLEKNIHSSISQDQEGNWYCEDGEMLQDPVIVVGTDGSGTRVVAKLLSMVGTTVLVEGTVAHQMDVDGRSAGVHFTVPIRHILQEAQSSYYNISTPPLSEASIKESRRLVELFARSMRINACQSSKHNLWAFKKPDLMNLLPFLQQAFPNMQVLHVVRDGRDMAFSKNLGPLEKYGPYLKETLDSSMKNALDSLIEKDNEEEEKEEEEEEEDRENIHHHFRQSERQMALWAHENEGVAQWGRMNLNQYRWVKIEDFNSPIKSIGFKKVITELSQIRNVESIISENNIEQVMIELRGKSMGSHDKGSLPMKQRYGKWVELAPKQEIVRLEAIGESTLKMFGYLPGELTAGKARL